jgi:hypothetical protein
MRSFHKFHKVFYVVVSWPVHVRHPAAHLGMKIESAWDTHTEAVKRQGEIADGPAEGAYSTDNPLGDSNVEVMTYVDLHTRGLSPEKFGNWLDPRESEGSWTRGRLEGLEELSSSGCNFDRYLKPPKPTHKWTAIDISSLENNVRNLGKVFECHGFTIEIYVHRSGKGGDPLTSRSSYVDLNVEKEIEDDVISASATFLANGYGSLSSRGEFGGGGGWRPMAHEAVKAMLAILERQKWKP